MSDWNDFEFQVEGQTGADEYQNSARGALTELFESNRNRVFFANQLAIQQEDKFFHWITSRALRDLIETGLIKTENRPLAIGSALKLVWHRSYRYYRRDATRITELVNDYGSPIMCASIGLHGEQMVLGGFARKQFLLEDTHTRRYGDKSWTKTDHNLDFIFSKDGLAYGVEVKNTLSYMDQEEFRVKIEMCQFLGITPVFAVRMLPRSWIFELIKHGGYAMILKFQLYPWTHTELAKRVRTELGLPVDAPRALKDGTMEKFVNWHLKRL